MTWRPRHCPFRSTTAIPTASDSTWSSPAASPAIRITGSVRCSSTQAARGSAARSPTLADQALDLLDLFDIVGWDPRTGNAANACVDPAVHRYLVDLAVPDPEMMC